VGSEAPAGDAIHEEPRHRGMGRGQRTRRDL